MSGIFYLLIHNVQICWAIILTNTDSPDMLGLFYLLIHTQYRHFESVVTYSAYMLCLSLLTNTDSVYMLSTFTY